MTRPTTDALAFTAGLATRRAAAGVLFVDGPRLLLIQPTYKSYWDLPGGIVESGESPRDAAAREVKEELGLVVQPGRLLVVDYFPATAAATEALMFVFAGGPLTWDQQSAIRLQHDEIGTYTFVGIEQMRVLTAHAPLLQRRIAAAWQALADGTTPYLEAGSPPVAGPWAGP